MAKAQSEVRRIFKGKKKYDEEDFEELTYLKLVVKEALRVHLPAPLITPRKCREQTNINRYIIPIKTRVLVNAWALARDPQSWVTLKVLYQRDLRTRLLTSKEITLSFFRLVQEEGCVRKCYLV